MNCDLKPGLVNRLTENPLIFIFLDHIAYKIIKLLHKAKNKGDAKNVSGASEHNVLPEEYLYAGYRLWTHQSIKKENNTNERDV